MAMLKRDEELADRGGGDLNALLGKGSEFEGKLTFEGTVRIDGKFSGEIHTNDVLVIGEGARVQAEINAGSVVINGEVQGNIRAKTSIELHHPARVRGNLEAPSLSIDKGVIFEGTSKMETQAQGGAKPATPMVVATAKPLEGMRP
jgi:cytoskeletal protein CcmA (bactofilin family)